MDCYVKERLLGKGSFGTVYLTRTRATDEDCRDGVSRFVVLKEIRISDEDQRSAARREGRLLSQLNHPHIIRYLDSFEAEDNLCLVLEYCCGGDLQALIRKRRGVYIPEPQTIDWFRMLVSALDYLHQRKILHRDIKTGNIFVSQDGRTLKLGDFGAAKVLERTGQMALTCVGTPTYLSPEICGRKSYDSKSDIWSLGCVIYQMMTLRPPFAGRNLNQLLGQILRGHFLPMPARYSYELRTTVSQMLRKNPDERPSAEMLLRKRFFLTGMTQHSPPKRISSAPPSVRHNRKASLGPLAVYASPMIPRRTASALASNRKTKKVGTAKSPRRRWKTPTETLISALSSLGLTDDEEEDVSPSGISSPDSSSTCTSSLMGTCILNPSDSAFSIQERWTVSLEETHGVHQLKEVSRQLQGILDPAGVGFTIRNLLDGQIPELALAELIEYFIQQNRIYMS